MAEAYSFEIREQAEELYVVSGMTYEAVAEVTGVSVTQLKRWSAESRWTERRLEYRKALSDIKRNTILLRKRLIEKALQSLDPQDVYAVSRLESASAKAVKEEPETPVSEPAEHKIIRTPQDALEALQDVVERKINGLLTQPGAITLKAVKEMREALGLIESMKERYKDPVAETENQRVLDEAGIKALREQLGL